MEWVDFLRDNHIPYVTRGPNTKRGEVSVKCPWCAEEDPSEHLGINLTTGYWGCHRNPLHRGKSKTFLIQGLLHCSRSQAWLVVSQYNQADPDTLEQALVALNEAPEAKAAPADRLIMPEAFRCLIDHGSGTRFCNYLRNRGFNDPEFFSRQYRLKCCTTGRWKDRIIFPVFKRGKLVAWTGRAIGNTLLAPRYLSTSDVIKTVIFNEDEIYLGGKNLFITEGPIDALKVDYYGQKHGGRATCVFGTSITLDQLAILKQVSHKFRRVILLFDPEAVETAFDVNDWLPEATIGTLPSGVEDPGALSETQVITLVNSF